MPHDEACIEQRARVTRMLPPDRSVMGPNAAATAQVQALLYVGDCIRDLTDALYDLEQQRSDNAAARAVYPK